MPESPDPNWEIVEELARHLPTLNKRGLDTVTVSRGGYYPLDLHSRARELRRLVEALQLGAQAGGLPPMGWVFTMGPESSDSVIAWTLGVTVSLQAATYGDVYRS